MAVACGGRGWKGGSACCTVVVGVDGGSINCEKNKKKK